MSFGPARWLIGDRHVRHRLSRDQNNPDAPVEWETVTATEQHTVYSLEDVTILDADGHTETIRCTTEHPFYVDGIGWVGSSSLVAGEELSQPDGSLATVVSVTGEYVPNGVVVYNFTVANDHTYFVEQGGDAVWVHNACRLSVGREFEAAALDADRLTVQKALGKINGNSLEASGPHVIYGIIQNGELLHIGESGRELAVRFAEHQRKFSKLGIDEIEVITLATTEGKAAARLIETDLIKFFRDKLGYALRYNITNH